ncbi:MAG TPA: alpha-amylase family protein [Actinocrinis sp.]|jgi:glycosidase
MPVWPDHSIWWHLYPLGFLGAERAALPPDEPARNRLPRLANWLGYLVDLGCNGLILGPVFASETHGYDTVDHFKVDSRLGTEDDLVQFVQAAKARGVRIVLDGVFNHVGRSFPAFADAAARGEQSPYASWFRRGTGAGAEPAPSDGFRTFEGHHRLVELDHESPQVVEYVASVMGYWLDRGIDGWRLDAAYRIQPSFLRRVLSAVRERHPEAWFCGEVIHGDYAGYTTESGLDTVTQYELWKAIWSSLNDANFFELAWSLKRHNAMLESFAPQTFLGNHDVTRIASRLTDPRQLEHALVILLTVGGIPSIYAGDERALRGVKEDREGGDDAIRPAFPDSPSALPDDGLGTYRLHQQLIGLRRRHPWLVRARTEVGTLTNTAMTYTLTDPTADRASGPAPRRLAVALNLAEQPIQLALPPGAWRRIAGTGGFGYRHADLPAVAWSIADESGS